MAARRIVHAAGDATGAAVLAALANAVAATPSIEVREGLLVAGLVEAGGRIAGVRLADGTVLSARAVVLATGGIGGLYRSATSPRGATGRGLAMAARAGAVLRDMEFVQFHPTAIAVAGDPMPLATEALRGAGAILVDESGRRFMADVPGAELAPRDTVARAIHAEIGAGRRVYLDARASVGAAFPRRFPTVDRLCRAAGLDPVNAPIPVRPAAHYHMGGVKVDGSGRSSLAGLYAVGEVASTGLHGANRLASNSLIEGLVFARAIAEAILGDSAPSLRPRTAAIAEGRDIDAGFDLRALMAPAPG
ncbi:L-aspartate oxidase [Methylobrevis pamukkalensis]|uniref:L-aspartate oxidase n=2 Tax=Methylobrevis pamukkalensis TaxID=1439726 RepID=A0A1E3H7L4_9HYPH|nr:L-aspartate oxidase [Methylobrevis pamukkalensis]